jgi:hypothetical protein
MVAMQWELARMFGLKGWRLLAVPLLAGLGWFPLVIQSLFLTPSLFLAAVAGFLPIVLGTVFIAHNRMLYIGYGALLAVGIPAFLVLGADLWRHWRCDLGNRRHPFGYWRLYRWTMDRWREVLASCKP